MRWECLRRLTCCSPTPDCPSIQYKFPVRYKFSVSYLVEVDVGAEVDSPALTCRGATLFHALLTSEMVGVVPRYINLFMTCMHLLLTTGFDMEPDEPAFSCAFSGQNWFGILRKRTNCMIYSSFKIGVLFELLTPFEQRAQ